MVLFSGFTCLVALVEGRVGADNDQQVHTDSALWPSAPYHHMTTVT